MLLQEQVMFVVNAYEVGVANFGIAQQSSKFPTINSDINYEVKIGRMFPEHELPYYSIIRHITSQNRAEKIIHTQKRENFFAFIDRLESVNFTVSKGI